MIIREYKHIENESIGSVVRVMIFMAVDLSLITRVPYLPSLHVLEVQIGLSQDIWILFCPMFSFFWFLLTSFGPL